MKKYKLKKWYPSLPQDWVVGMEIAQGDRGSYSSYSPCSGVYKDYYIVSEIVERNPEYWEEVSNKKDYEILSFSYPEKWGKKLAVLKEDGRYHTDKCDWKLDALLNIGACVKSGHVKIHSIRRLSDDETFSLEDKIKQWGTDNYLPIEKIYFNEHNQLSYKLKGVEAPLVGVFTNNTVKGSSILFTTEDDIDIREGDEYYCIDENFKFSVATGVKRFSTKEKAEKYILLNKPCLSFNDVWNIGDSKSSDNDYIVISKKQLKELVKAKIDL